jgi:hypothetical protein
MYTLETIKQFIKAKCVINGHGTKYWKKAYKNQQKAMRNRKCQS